MECAANLASRRIAVRVQDSVAAVRRFARERQLCALAVELRSPVNQLLDSVRSFLHQNVRRIRVNNPIPGIDGVLQVQADLVFVAERNPDSALGILRGGFRKFLLRQHQHLACFSQRNGRAQPGHAGSHDDEIHLCWRLFHVAKMVSEEQSPCVCARLMPAGFAGGARLEGEGTASIRFSSRDHLSSIYVQNIRVRTKPNPYYVKVGAGLLRRAGREVRRVLPAAGSRVFVITSPNVRRHWGEALEKSLRDARLPYEVLEMHDGEPAKRLHTVEQLAESLVDAKADRKSLLVAFGGGVVGDSAGFLAAVFMRGVPVVQLPTTVVAQVDASIGGKTGVNLRGGKNLVGSFHQPSAVLVDPDLLATLDDRESRSAFSNRSSAA